MNLKNNIWDSPGSPVVKTLHLHAGGMGSVPHPGNKIPHAAQHWQKKKKPHLGLHKYDEGL